MAFSSGFSAGLQLGNNIKRNRLDREMLDWRKQSAADDLALNKQLADQRAQQVADDMGLRRDDLALRRDDLTMRRENLAGDNSRADSQLSDTRRNAITSQLTSALEAARRNRLVEAQIAAMQAKAAGLTGPTGDMTTTTEELDPETGEVLSTKRTTRARGMPPAGPAQVRIPDDPTAAAAKTRINELDQQIAQDRIAQAQGDNRYGFLNLRSRQGRVDDAQGEIQRLAPLARASGVAPAPTAQSAMPPRQLPPAIQQQFDQQLAEAVKWAQANPNDPRAAAIMQRVQAMQPR